MADRVRRVLVVEDEMLVAMLMEDYLDELGYEVVGPAMRLDRALKTAAEENFDFAILDINLAGEKSFPVADLLRARGVPFIFATGYGVAGLTEAHRDAVVLQKPFRIEDLQQAMERAS